jgi:putative ABC transport system permease protein
MNLQENIKEGLRSVKGNMLRSVLTALIIAIGIMALVGILTAIDSMQASVSNSFAEFGANSFDIKIPEPQRGFGGMRRPTKSYPPITFREAKLYADNLNVEARVSISTIVGSVAEVQNGSKKTNPNIMVIGISKNYLENKFLDLQEGRDFSDVEQERGTFSIILGYEVAEKLFGEKSPINQAVTLQGGKYLVIGVLKKEGSSRNEAGGDRSVLLPLERARTMANNSKPSFNITTVLSNNLDAKEVMGEATILMRKIRKDKIGQPDSFEISSSESLVERLNNITGYLKMGGYIVGFITLLGASIGLMNIMMVSVTERTREIGVRKALGATPSRIRQQFLIEAIVICQLGGIVGVILGIAIGNFVAVSLNAGSFVIPWTWIVVSFLVCVAVGVISGWYPAYKASQLDPIESLRFE